MRRRYTVTMNKSKKKSKTRKKKQAQRSGQTGRARVSMSVGDSSREKMHLGLAREGRDKRKKAVPPTSSQT